MSSSVPTIKIGEVEFEFFLYGGGSRWRPCVLLYHDGRDLLTVQFIRCGHIATVLIDFIIYYDPILLDTEV